MIRFILAGFKLTVLTIVILLIGQIPVGVKTISGHVGDLTRSPLVQKPIRWVGQKFDFSENRLSHAEKLAAAKNSAKAKASHVTQKSESESESDESDKGKLSGLLKSEL